VGTRHHDINGAIAQGERGAGFHFCLVSTCMEGGTSVPGQWISVAKNIVPLQLVGPETTIISSSFVSLLYISHPSLPEIRYSCKYGHVIFITGPLAAVEPATAVQIQVIQQAKDEDSLFPPATNWVDTSTMYRIF
jgi:hypothetical protein